MLYRTIAAHLPAFLARPAGADGHGGWPRFVQREFEAYLKMWSGGTWRAARAR